MDILTDSAIGLLIQGGAVGLALFSIYGLIYALRMAFNHLSTIGEQIGRSTAVQEHLVDAVERLVDKIDPKA